MTPHIEAKKEEIAPIVLMPGDPLRAKYIAETYLENATLVSSVRGILAYTGIYNHQKITVMASGMGMPSMGIYSYELYSVYDVKTIIRIGTCGTAAPNIKTHDLILAEISITNSNYAYQASQEDIHELPASSIWNQKIITKAQNLSYPIHFGKVYCSDVFYSNIENPINQYQQHQILATEMESFALFYNARKWNREAACLLTVTDHFVTKDQLSPQEREQALNKMIVLVLETCTS